MAQLLSKLSPEMLTPRLGEYVVQKGLISEQDLQKALAYQQAQVSKGKSYLLGQALLELNMLSRDALDQVVTEQIIQLRSALQASHSNLEEKVKARTAELSAALQRLSELSQMKANFVSTISHELRTPLTHVKGYLDLLVTESLGKISDEQRQALQVTQRAAAKLESMIEDLIMFSLATRGEMSINLGKVNICHLVELLAKTSAAKSEERGVRLVLSLADHALHVRADSEKIGWALNQLIDNGIKFTPSGGAVTITVSQSREAEELVDISVADTGIGIPPDRIKEIFEPFHQLDDSSTRHYEGTGLGLSLVRQIVEAHGSLLAVKSTAGEGSIFQFPLLAIRD